MTAILLSPHCDDETLFAAYTCLRHRPYVVTCLYPADGDRVLETEAALDVLGCEGEQWGITAANPDWRQIDAHIARAASVYDTVFAPQPNHAENGHDPDRLPPRGFGILHHDYVGAAALRAFGPDRTVLYQTYTRWGGGRTRGTTVPYEPSWPGRKLRAMACYESQVNDPATQPWFANDWLEEWYA